MLELKKMDDNGLKTFLENGEPSTLEFLGANISEGFDNSLPGIALDKMQQNFADQAYADPTREATRKKFTKEEWAASEYKRDGVVFEDGWSEDRARFLAEGYDERKEREQILKNGNPDGMFSKRGAIGFVGQMIGGLPDPVNLIPFGGLVKGAGLGVKLGSAALEGAAGNLAVSAVTRPYYEDRGIDSTWQDYASDVFVGGALGGIFGGAGHMLETAKVRRETLTMKDRQVKAEAADTAIKATLEGEPLDLDRVNGFNDTVKKLYDISDAERADLIQVTRSKIEESGLNPEEANIAATLHVANSVVMSKHTGISPAEYLGSNYGAEFQSAEFIDGKIKKTYDEGLDAQFDGTQEIPMGADGAPLFQGAKKQTVKKNKLFKGKEFNDLDIIQGGQYSRGEEVASGQLNLPKATLKRAQKAGFDVDHAWFHGSKANIEAFADSALGASTGAGSAKIAHFFASSPSTASDYAKASSNKHDLAYKRKSGDLEKQLEDLNAKKRKSKAEKAQIEALEKELDSAASDYASIENKRLEGSGRMQIEYDIKNIDTEIKYLEEKVSKGESKEVEKITGLKEVLSKNEMLLSEGQWVKLEGMGWNILDKEGNKIPNGHEPPSFITDTQKIEESRYRHFDSKEVLIGRTEKLKKRLEQIEGEDFSSKLEELKATRTELESRLHGDESLDAGEVVYPTVLKMENPLIVDFKDSGYREVTYREILEKAQEAGHDGVIFKNTYDPAFVGGGVEHELIDVAAVFEPKQIRSVFAEFKDLNSDNILYKKSNGKERGAIQFADDKKALISLFSEKNESTILHESAHLFLKNYQRLEVSGKAPQAIIDDLNTLRDWAGKQPNEKGLDADTQFHEKVAKGFEAYLKEGKAPVKELQGIFDRMREWLTSIYKNADDLKVTISPEARKVFDRMLALEPRPDTAPVKPIDLPVLRTSEELDASVSALKDETILNHRMVSAEEKADYSEAMDSLNKEEAELNALLNQKPETFFQAAYHGTPHKFDKFSTDKIGAGEGTQYEGWGLYFTSKKRVAEWYRQALGENENVFTRGDEKLTGDDLLKEYFTPGRIIKSYGGLDKVIEFKQDADRFSVYVQSVDSAGNPLKGEKPRYHSTRPDIEKMKSVLSKEGWSHTPEKGQTYKVEIPDDNKFLDRDNLLSKQPEMVEKVKAAFNDLMNDPEVKERMPGASNFNPFNSKEWEGIVKGKDAYDSLSLIAGSDKAASAILLKHGIPGLKYDGGQHSPLDVDIDHSNYVLFDESHVEIKETFYQGAETKLDDKGEPIDPITEAFNKTLAEQEAARIRLIEIAVQKKELKRQAYLNLEAREKTYSQVKSLMDQGVDPEKAILSLLEGGSSLRGMQGSGNSLDARINAIGETTSAKTFAKLRELDPRIEKAFMDDPQFNENVILEMLNIGKGEPGISKDPMAAKAAKIFSELMEGIRERANLAGAQIGKLDGYIPRFHDLEKMLGAGNREKWVQYVKEHIDLDRSFKGLSGKDLEDAIDITYQNMTSGEWLTKEAGQFDPVDPLPNRPRNIAKRMEAERTLHFKTPEAELSYLKEFGQGRNILGMMVKHLQNHSRKIGIMESLGTQPEANLASLYSTLRQDIRVNEPDLIKRAKEIEKLNFQSVKNRETAVGKAFMLAMGEGTSFANPRLKHFGSMIRLFNSLSKLGAATLSQFTDFAQIKNEARLVTGNNQAGAWVEVLKDYFKGVSPEVRTQVLDHIATLGDGMNYANFNRFDQDNVNNWVGRMSDKMFKYSGQNWHTNKGKSAMALIITKSLGKNMDKSWDSLAPNLKAMLSQYGSFDETKWNMLKEAKPLELDGVKYFHPGMINEIPVDKFKQFIPEGLEGKELEGALRREKYKLETDLQTFFLEEIRNGMLEPDARVRRLSTFGLKAGTPEGEAARLMMQFKSFSIAYSDRVLGGKRFSDVNSSKWGESLKGDPSGAIQHVVASLGLAYMSMVAKDLSKGLEPKDPTLGKTWLMAGFQSGGLGIMGDFMQAGISGRSGVDALSTLAGPTWSTASSIINIGGRTIREPFSDNPNYSGLAEDYTSFAKGNVPFGSLWYTRAAVNYLVWDRLKEALEPGSIRRSERRLKKEYNQQSLRMSSFGF